MRLVIWAMSRLKRQKPRDPSWYKENLQTWTPYEDAQNAKADEAARVKWMTDHRNKRLEEETP